MRSWSCSSPPSRHIYSPLIVPRHRHRQVHNCAFSAVVQLFQDRSHRNIWRGIGSSTIYRLAPVHPPCRIIFLLNASQPFLFRPLLSSLESCLPFAASGLSKSSAPRCIVHPFFVRTVTFWPQAPPEEAPILCVAPHSTFFDALAVAVMGAPSVVAKAETKSVPFFGSLIRYVMPTPKTGLLVKKS